MGQHQVGFAGTDSNVKDDRSDIEKKNAEMARQRAEEKALAARVPEREKDILNFVTGAIEKHFGVERAHFKSRVKEWNFPYSLKSKRETHRVARWYAVGGGFFLDVFDSGTPAEEIERIKTGIEALGFRYTYVIGKEKNDDLGKVLFEQRIKKSEPKNKPRVETSDNSFTKRMRGVI